jgi:anti-sigma B factor antagonist
MNISKTQEGKKLTLALEGRLDAKTAGELKKELEFAFENNTNELILDFNKLDYVSSAGLRVLLAGFKIAMAKNASFALTGVSSDIKEVLDITGFSDMLTII